MSLSPQAQCRNDSKDESFRTGNSAGADLLLSECCLVIPKGPAGPLSSVLVVHEKRGLNPYIEDVARRLGVEGFLSLAPDALSPLGGYPGNDDDRRALQAKRRGEEMLEDFIEAARYLAKYPRSNGKVGVVGFCCRKKSRKGLNSGPSTTRICRVSPHQSPHR